MKCIALAGLLMVGLVLSRPESAMADQPKPHVGQVAAVNHSCAINMAAFNQRYTGPVFGAWINEPYTYWQAVPDITTGTIQRVQRIGTTRRLVWVYYDNWTNAYCYQDQFGNILPYQSSQRWFW